MELRKELDEKINGYLNVVPEVKEYPAYDPQGSADTRAITCEGAAIGSKKQRYLLTSAIPQALRQGTNCLQWY